MTPSHRKTPVGTLCATPLLLVALLSAAPAGAARDCRGRLDFSADYACEFRSDLAASMVDGTLSFEEFDGNAFVATLDVLGETSTAYCTCKTSPPRRFDRASGFECVTGLAADVAETMEGRVNGNGRKISKGQIWSADPLGSGFARFAFACTLESSGLSGADSDSDSESDSGEDSDSDGDSDGDSGEDSDADDDSDSDSDDDSDGDSGAAASVVICHKGKKTLEVPESALQRHLRHGDSLGPCS